MEKPGAGEAIMIALIILATALIFLA